MNVPQDMVVRYMERRKQDLEACLMNLENRNFDAIEKVGHQLKGNGLTFGHADLSSIGSHLEVAASAKNIIELEKAIQDLSQWIGNQIN